MLQRFFRQFSGPEGALGHVAGWLMAHKNAALNAWLVERLEVGPDDRVVEVGFGPGLAVVMNAARATRGRVAGIDRSAVMLRQASARACRAGLASRVDLRVGSAEQLPFADAAFTRGLVVNSLQFWPSPEAGVRELARVLAPGARLVVALRMQRAGAGRFDRSRYGATEERIKAVSELLRGAGFAVLEQERRDVADEALTALIARR